MNSKELSLIGEIFKIIITSLLTGSFTYWITFKKVREEKRYWTYKKLLEKVYGPIVNIVNSSIHPGDGYQGTDESDLRRIIKIIEDNSLIVDPRLYSFAWLFTEELTYSRREIYDLDGKFFDYVFYRYNYLRKKVYLPYDSSYFIFCKQCKKIYRRIRFMGRKVKHIFWKKNKRIHGQHNF